MQNEFFDVDLIKQEISFLKIYFYSLPLTYLFFIAVFWLNTFLSSQFLKTFFSNFSFVIIFIPIIIIEFLSVFFILKK